MYAYGIVLAHALQAAGATVYVMVIEVLTPPRPEKKEDMKRRGLASPDIADALALTFAQAVRPEEDYRWDGAGGGRIIGSFDD